MKTYLVGGAVRDLLLGLPVTDRDWVVVGSTPQAMLDKGFRQVGKDFPVFLHPETGDEYALARTERKAGKGYKGFTVHAAPDVTLEQDLERRDLTINAIAQADTGEIIDPFDGQTDLKSKKLRHVSPAFVEDPLRILRVARLYARFKNLGFSIAQDTEILMREIVREGEITTLTTERVWQEFEKALKTEHPACFFEALRACGAHAALFPELENLFGVPNPPKWHPEIDSGIHNLMVLTQAAKLTEDCAVRFAALLHDLGKGVTPIEIWPQHLGHEEKGVALVDQFCERYRVPKHMHQLAQLVCRYHAHCHRALELRPKTLVKLFEKLDAFRRPERFKQFLLACEADARGCKDAADRDYPQPAALEKYFEVARDVDIQGLIAEGYTGEQLGEAIHKARLSQVKKAMKSD